MIPQPGKTEKRPLSVAPPRDKIIQKALQTVLEAIWEPEFSESSYGFRPGKSIHQLLYQLHRHGSRFPWVIQGDISKCFDAIPHSIINNLVGNKVVCEKTRILLRRSLVAGYECPETKKIITPTCGTPQGSVISPLLANIVLHELDKFMESTKKTFERGKGRARNPVYDALMSKIQRVAKYKTPNPDLLRQLVLERRRVPSALPIDPNFKRMLYFRYADDFIVLIIGSNDDATHIKNLIKGSLIKKCGLKLNEDKTLITRTEDGFHFLGALCQNPRAAEHMITTAGGRRRRAVLRMRILAPIPELLNKLKTNKFVKTNAHGKYCATARKDLVNFSHYEIIRFYNHRINGLLAFYSFAGNLNSLRSILSLLQISCALTFALKYKLRTARKAFTNYGTYLKDPDTDVQLEMPSTLKVRHDYKGFNRRVDISPDVIDSLLSQSL